MDKPYKIISLSHPEDDYPQDVTETSDAIDANEYAEHMASCGYYVVVECYGIFQYKIDGRA